MKRNGIKKYLGAFIENETIVSKEFEGVVEIILGRLNKWKLYECLIEDN